jgi:hypothetical protein
MSISTILAVGTKLIDKLIPDPDKKALAQLELMKLQQDGQLKEIELQLSAIVAEAQSADKWTSRARPSLMYIFYILILSALPFGLAYVNHPEAARLFVIGLEAWFDSIPEYIVQAFTIGYLGYTGGRSLEKIKKVAK